MKVREMWENEPSTSGQWKANRDRKRQALTYELKMLFNRQLAIYTQLKDAGVVVAPEDTHITLANKSDYIWISTIRHIGIPSDFVVPYDEENRKIEQLFHKMNQRADKIKSLLISISINILRSDYDIH